MKKNNSTKDIALAESTDKVIEEFQEQEAPSFDAGAEKVTPEQEEKEEREFHHLESSVPTLEETKARYAEEKEIRKHRKENAKVALNIEKTKLNQLKVNLGKVKLDPSKKDETAKLEKQVAAQQEIVDEKDLAVKLAHITYKPELAENKTILAVRHLRMFFRLGAWPNYVKLKAVHDVSFDIKEGETFGIVGESGCGKSTTGRCIMHLYDITSGSIYFKGYRVGAGDRWNKKEIKYSNIHANEAIADLKREEATRCASASNAEQENPSGNPRENRGHQRSSPNGFGTSEDENQSHSL